MNKSAQETLVSAWIAAGNTEIGSDIFRQNLWALEELDDLVEQSAARALEVILAILATAPSSGINDVKAKLAAGPMENLLSRHGAEIIESVEKEASANPQFRLLLGGVWRSDMPEEIWLRIRAIADSTGWD
ncbi:MAG TPA: hypothetical protein VHC22_32420 [Pirellulales bacterium]|nr:hypothetical protein [Pirellulales bacterium]